MVRISTRVQTKPFIEPLPQRDVDAFRFCEQAYILAPIALATAFVIAAASGILASCLYVSITNRIFFFKK